MQDDVEAGDPDGLAASPIYTFTWIRIDGASESVITTTRTDLPRSRHLLTAADARKKVKVKVDFEDHVGNDETLESEAFPSFGTVAWNTDSTCAMPDLTGRELVWTGRMTVGSHTSDGIVSYGYSTSHSGSTLSDKTFTLGTTGYALPSTDPLKDQATTPNAVAAFTTGTNGVPSVVNGTPSVSSVAFAGTAQALAIGETIVVEAVFTEAVRVRTGSSARPQIALSMGSKTRQAGYARGSGTDTLTLRVHHRERR